MDDRIALRITLTILAVLALLWARPAFAGVRGGVVPGDYCNAPGERVPWSPERKAATRERVQGALAELGVARAVRAYHDAIVYRESFGGEASVVHALGEDSDGVPEYGLGTHGLSLRWHADKWGEDADPAFCTPEVSTVVAHELIWRAVTRFGARNLVEVQSVYAGAFECRAGACRFTLAGDRRSGLCGRLRARGVSCWAPITERDLGRRLGAEDRRTWALQRAREWVAEHLGRSSPAERAPRTGAPNA
jgi:hypothetical protein